MDATASRKVPEGKLVQVRVRYDERIESCALRGDFFLEPPEALKPLEAAVEGAPADATPADLTARVARVDATLVGFDAADVARVVRDAVDASDT